MFFRVNVFVQNRQCNDKKKEKKTRSTKHCQKTNDWVIQIPLKPTGPKSDTLDWKAVSVPPVTSIVFILWHSSCLSCDIHRVYLVTSIVFILWHPSCLSCDIHRVYLVTSIVFILSKLRWYVLNLERRTRLWLRQHSYSAMGEKLWS
jgi:hypothetical protein